MSIDLLATNSQDFTGTNDPQRPDYVSPQYREMAPRWQVVNDIRGSTIEIRNKKEVYLPRFEAEDPRDWDARVKMTFVADHYTQTLEEHVGLVFAQPIKLGDDVPQAIRDLTEDIDGEGNQLDVFATSALEEALHLGHVVLLTDYPVTDNVETLADVRQSKIRPYVTLYKASDIRSWRHATVGGVRVLVQIVLRESGCEEDGEFGVKDVTRYREIKQEVFYDEVTGRARGLGKITWRAWKEVAADGAGKTFVDAGSGTIVGPSQIAARVVYGGEKMGPLHTKPHAFGLAMSNVEETQVSSDYAAVMHKCNVPTPCFVNRVPAKEGETVQMGQGIDLGPDGDAFFLEPAGAALAATRQRIEDLRAQMRRQGAASDDSTGKVMTAAEARLYAKQRNAKLTRAARSLQDALEGVFADMAAFMKIAKQGPVKSGGSVVVNQDFAGEGLDPALLSVFIQAYREGILPLDAVMYAMEKGRLPEDFSAEDAALQLIANELDVQDRQAADKQRLADEAKNSQPPVSEAA